MGAALNLPDAWPIIDSKKLQSIKDLSDPDEEDDFFKDLLSIFFQRAPSLLAEMETALSSLDVQKFERTAHALKGTSGNLGAMRMMKLSEQLETMGRSGNLEGARLLLNELQAVYPETKQELETQWL